MISRDRDLTERYEERFEVEDSEEWTVAMAEYNREADAITAALFRAQGQPGLARLYLTKRRAFDRRMERGRLPFTVRLPGRALRYSAKASTAGSPAGSVVAADDLRAAR